MSLQPVEYYNKLPQNPNVDVCFVLDPIIATGSFFLVNTYKTGVIYTDGALTGGYIGNTAVATVNILKEWGISGENIKFVGVLGVSYQTIIPEMNFLSKLLHLISTIKSQRGIAHLQEEHPDIHIYVAAVDETLDGHG